MSQIVLITGAAQRIGAEIARTLHRHGANIVLHYRHSLNEAQQLQRELNHQRAESCKLVQGNLNDHASYQHIIDESIRLFGRLDALINNASTFYPTPLGSITPEQWDDLFASNLKAPLFLAQAAAPHLAQTQGCIINIVDIHADRPLKNHPVYCAAKAGLVMLTKSLARELGPQVRVNAIAPGAILWPEHELDEETKHDILSRTALKRQGQANDIANAALFLLQGATYTTGHILTVDGGRSLHC